ncbi:polysaccharide lyase family 8 super-sandwich domain-containing protein [Paenibacillus sp. strain BS8-2]
MMNKWKARKWLCMMLIISMLVPSLLVTKAAHADVYDEFDLMRMKWFDMLTGGSDYDPQDADVAAQLATITANANTYWSSMNTSSERTYLWSDAASWTVSATLTTNYNRLYAMSAAYATSGSALYENASLASDIVNALDWMYTNKFNTSTTQYDNWWDFEIGSPKKIVDIMVLLYDQLSPTQITNYGTVLNKFVPNPSTDMSHADGANLSDKAQAAIVHGIVGKLPSRIAQGRDALSRIFPYVTSGDGFYEDGSFIQHNRIAYTGSYGSVLLSGFANLLFILRDTTWEVTDPSVNNVYRWVTESFQPLIYKGAIMDNVAGRSMSRQNTNDHKSGRSIVLSILKLAEGFSAAKELELKSMVKAWVMQDTTYANYFVNMSLFNQSRLRALMNDDSIQPMAETYGNYAFASMDRFVHVQPGYAFGLSLFSDRISSFESINQENLKGWYTGAGMTYLYNDDLAQHSDNFWPTIDSFRLPGTTTDGSGKGVTPKNGNKFMNTSNWVGGSSVNGMYGSAGMQFSLTEVTGSPLQGKKSWFMFGDKIAALGTGIKNTNTNPVETIVENRKLNAAGDNTLIVDGNVKSTALGWSETMNGIEWANLSGSVPGSDIGYYFPGTATITGLRESRTGDWYDINTRMNEQGSTVTNNFLSLAFEHGAQPANGSYSYVLLPNKDAAATAAYAANPDIVILENSTEAQAVKDTALNAVGANFWNDGTKTISVDGASFLTSDKKASITTLESANELDIAVSDPTHTNTSPIHVEINRSAAGVITLDPNVTVTQLSPSIKLTVNASGSQGKSHETKFMLSTSSAPEAPVLNGVDVHNLSADLHWSSAGGESGYNIVYGTSPGVYTHSIPVQAVSASNSFTVTGLAGGASYYFAVRAVNSEGESGPSNEWSVVTPNLLVIESSDDAFVQDGSYANTNYGSEQILYTKTGGAGYSRNAYVKFDLSSIPSDVLHAYIQLVPVSAGMEGIVNEAHLINDHTWTESTVTWNNQPIAGELLSSFVVATDRSPVQIDVTDEVNAALHTSGSISIRVSSPTNPGSQGFIYYGSKEYEVEAYRPIIVYVKGPTMLTASEDALVRGGTYATTNYGSAVTLVTKNESEAYTRESYIKFDLSSLATEVSDAKIRLTTTRSGMDGVLNGAKLVSDNSWSETGINWNNKPAASGDAIATWTLQQASTVVEFDVTDLINAAIANNENAITLFIFSLESQGSASDSTYASRENADAAKRPMLIYTEQ